MPRIAVSVIALALLSAHCSPVTTPGADASSDSGTTGWRVRVLLGPGLPLTPGVGFAVRAENAAGQVFEQTAGADGVVPLGVARDDGPWDITVARAGCRAVSILGVDGDFDGDVYSECDGVQTSPSPHIHTLAVRVAGFNDLSQGPTICPGGFLQSDTPDRWRTAFDYRAGVPPTEVWAVLFDSMNSRARPLNVARLPPISLLDQDMLVTVTLPTTPVPVVRTRVTVQFPTEGLLTAADGVGAAGYESVTRGLSANGAIAPCTVGRGTWTDPDADGRATFEIESFAPPFEPDSAAVPLAINRNGAAVSGGLRVRTFADGAVVTIPPVRALRLETDATATQRFVVDAPGYDGGYFFATAAVPNIQGIWEGYTAHGASLNGRRFPRLPSTVSRSDLTSGFGQTDHFVATACVANHRPGSRDPWTPAGPDLDLNLCSAVSRTLSP